MLMRVPEPIVSDLHLVLMKALSCYIFFVCGSVVNPNPEPGPGPVPDPDPTGTADPDPDPCPESGSGPGTRRAKLTLKRRQ